MQNSKWADFDVSYGFTVGRLSGHDRFEELLGWLVDCSVAICQVIFYMENVVGKLKGKSQSAIVAVRKCIFSNFSTPFLLPLVNMILPVAVEFWPVNAADKLV